MGRYTWIGTGVPQSPRPNPIEGVILKYFRIKNWHEFQHYKDRNPPWIKLYTSLLCKTDGLMLLKDSERSHILLLFLAAAMNGNRLPFDNKLIKQLIRATTDVDLKALHSLGLIEFVRGRQSASKMLAPSASKMLCLEETEKRREEKSTNSEPTARRTKRPARQRTEFQLCLGAFKNCHENTLGLPYVDTYYARDNKALTGPLKTYGISAVLEMIGYFWAEQQERENGNETWIGKATPHIPGFVSKIPLILRDYTVESYGKEAEQGRSERRVSDIREGQPDG